MAATVSLDGVDVSGVAIKGSATRRLNRPAQAEITIPMDAAIGGVGSRLKIGFPGLFFHGMVIDCETDTGEDTGYTRYNAMDPMEMWNWRPCRDFGGETPGNFIDPSFLERMETGPQIMEELFLASENPAGIPGTAEGPLFLDLGTFAGGGADLSGAPCTWPMTIGDLFSLLTSTGELDAVITPTDPGGGIMGTVDCFNGDYGTDLSGSVEFEYATGALNVRRLRWNEDMSNLSNKIQYFFAPKETIRRYKGNITGDDPCLETQIGAAEIAALLAARLTSRSTYGTRMEIQEFEVDELEKEQEPLGTCVSLDPTRVLYRQLWYLESWIRLIPRTLIHVTPTRGTAIGAFDIGDLVTVSAGASVRGGFTGAQRVYQYTISWDEDGPFELSELQTSADQEGF